MLPALTGSSQRPNDDTLARLRQELGEARADAAYWRTMCVRIGQAAAEGQSFIALDGDRLGQAFMREMRRYEQEYHRANPGRRYVLLPPGIRGI